MIQKLLRLVKKEYRTLNTIELSKTKLLHNYRYLKSLDKKIKIAPVLKSNAYGHGIKEISSMLDSEKAPFFCVDSLYEAYGLLKQNIKTPVLILGYTNPENFKVKKLPFSFAVYDLETAKILNQYQKGSKVHIFVDTGMNREGISLNELSNFLTTMKQCNNLIIDGLMSHLASWETNNDRLLLNQVKNFKKAQEIFIKHRIKPKWIHLANSGALVNPRVRPLIASISNLCRAGISLYGLSSTIADKNLKPFLTLKTNITQIKTLKKGDKVGYDGTFTAKKDMSIGVLPIGYNDGIDRRLSNKGYVLIDGIICQIIGRVSMNITTIDISKVKNSKIGDEVIVYSNNPNDLSSIENSANFCKTIPYDLLVKIDRSIKRYIM